MSSMPTDLIQYQAFWTSELLYRMNTEKSICWGLFTDPWLLPFDLKQQQKSKLSIVKGFSNSASTLIKHIGYLANSER